MRVGAILGLGLAYAGKQREEVGELLTPLITDMDLPMEVVGYAALALGLVFVGSCNQDSVEAILQVRMAGFLPVAVPVRNYWAACLSLLAGKPACIQWYVASCYARHDDGIIIVG